MFQFICVLLKVCTTLWAGFPHIKFSHGLKLFWCMFSKELMLVLDYALCVQETGPKSLWSIWRLLWPCIIYGDTASAEVGAFILLVLCGADHLWSEFIFFYRTFRPQPIMSNRSCMEPSAFLLNLRRMVMWCGAQFGLRVPLEAPIMSHHPHGASDHIFTSSINWLLDLKGYCGNDWISNGSLLNQIKSNFICHIHMVSRC